MSATDDLRASIKFRGLKESGFTDPVREFKGKLTGFDVVEAEFQGVKQGRNNIVLHFAEVEPIVSDPPWPYPVKDITIGYSESKRSRWGIFAESGLKFLSAQEEFSNLIGRRLHLKIAIHKLYQGKEKGEQPADCWEIVGVEGASASNNGADAMLIEKQLLMLLNGRTQQQFNMEALKMDAVKKDSAMVGKLLSTAWFTEVSSKGLVAKDETGIYALTEAGLAALQG
mgnify:CR=1 FL=1